MKSIANTLPIRYTPTAKELFAALRFVESLLVIGAEDLTSKSLVNRTIMAGGRTRAIEQVFDARAQHFFDCFTDHLFDSLHKHGAIEFVGSVRPVRWLIQPNDLRNDEFLKCEITWHAMAKALTVCLGEEESFQLFAA